MKRFITHMILSLESRDISQAGPKLSASAKEETSLAFIVIQG